MNRNEILIFTPTYNEADNIGPLIEQLFKLNLPADILVIDDSSPDGTGDVVARMMRDHLNLKLLRRDGRQGIGRAHPPAVRQRQAARDSLRVRLDAHHAVS